MNACVRSRFNSPFDGLAIQLKRFFNAGAAATVGLMRSVLENRRTDQKGQLETLEGQPTFLVFVPWGNKPLGVRLRVAGRRAGAFGLRLQRSFGRAVAMPWSDGEARKTDKAEPQRSA